MKRIELNRSDIEKLQAQQSGQKFNPYLIWSALRKRYQKRKKLQQQRANQLKARSRQFFEAKKQHIVSYSAYQKTLFFVSFLLFCALFFYSTFTYSAFKELYQTQSRIAVSTENIETLEYNLAKLSAAPDYSNQLKDYIEKMNQMAPYQPEEEQVIYILENLLQKNKLASPNRFQWTREKDAATDISELGDHYDIYSFNFVSSGSFEGVKAFLSDIRNSVRLIDLKTIQMVPLASGDIEFNATFWTYNQKNEDEI